jgi:hypothetical protein
MPNAARKDLLNFRPDASQAKNVEDTKMLDTMARETVNYNEKNVPGEESVTSHPNFGQLGMNRKR